MGKKFDKFLLLMWKNFLLQWRHPKQTVVEIMAPVLFCSLLVVIRSLVDPELHPSRFYTPFQNKIPILANMTTLRTIAWSPQHPLLEEIMNDTINKISMDHNVFLLHISFNDSESLGKYLSNELNLLITIAGIQFDDSLIDAPSLPPNISLTFRFPGELRAGAGKKGFGQYTWKTNLLFPVYQSPGPRGWDMNQGAEPSYYFEGFLKLQEELSYSLIKHFKQTVHNETFNRTASTIFMQRFPYPKWINDILLTALQTFVGLIIMLSFVYTCISTVKVITTEKEKQLKEAMKIMGLPNWLHWTAWFLKTIMLLIVTIILILILVKSRWYPGTNYTVFTQSNPFVIFIFMLFFACATTTFCFAISVFFSKANTAATIAGMAWFLSYFPYSFMQDKYDTLTLSQKLLASLCSNSAMAYGFQLMLMFEGIGEGLQWHNIWTTTTPDDNLTLGHLMVMLTVDTFIYLLIALYVEGVFPGDYGIPHVWYFPFTMSYWFGRPRTVGVIDDFPSELVENEFYEKEPIQLDVGVKIQHIRKLFGNKVAVRDLTLNMYENQITVLLGHNGAGKTTTMSMLTGMIPPTSGTAIVSGHDIRNNMNGVRESLGLCPQHNILFDELTVKEHLYFYSRLKGLDKKNINEEIKKYIELLELQSKENAQSSTLSGGMKRKLSVGVALCGNSKVVMCDEPTAGMDPAARRALWDLLQSQKKGRTILLTTHFMDEADLLGDRIAIMAGGKLQCFGSSFFLKKKYGAGYHLIMDKSPECNVNEVTSLLQKHIPHLRVENNVGSELSYLLNEKQSWVFEEMLSDLETNSTRLGILSYGISLTTLEEVFMKVGADHGQEEANNAVDENSENAMTTGDSSNVKLLNDLLVPNGIEDIPCDTSETKLNFGNHLLTGWKLWKNQFWAMLMKRGLSILRSWLLFLIQNCIPVLFLVLAIAVVRGVKPYRDLPNLKIELNSYNKPISVITYDAPNNYTKSFMNLDEVKNNIVLDWKNKNLSETITKETEDNPTTVRLRHITGATFNKSIIAWFNNEPFHSPPLSLKLAMNAILQKEVSPQHRIDIYNHPLPFTLNTRFTELARGHNMGFQIAFNIGFSMAFVSSFYIMSYVRERVSKSKHLQFVSGVDVLAFWGSSFICDLITFLFTSLCIIITLIIFQEDGFAKPSELARTLSILLYFGFSMLPMMYLASYFFDVPSTGYTRMTLINIFTGVAGFLIVQVMASPELDLQHISNTLHWIFLLIPHYSLSTGIRDVNVIYATHKLCNIMVEACINFDLPDFPHLTPEQCWKQLCLAQSQCCSMTKNYYAWKAPGIGRNVFFSCMIGILFIAILLLIEYRVLETILYKAEKHQPPPNPLTSEDSDVKTEKERIRNATPAEIRKSNLIIRDVTKYYKNFLAVNSLCLGVNRYECFGLLGVNGAGKTTTFKMMTGDIKFSFGDAWVNGLSLKSDMKRIHQLIGYCPQFDALLDDLTCRETIIIFSLLRGITLTDSKCVAERLAHEFDFLRHLDKKVRELSGGNKRKLSTAVSLIGDPLVLYLDEPTTGMDPATKRYLWNALCKVRDNGKCIVLTSHSMEECEALCTRLAIMVNGTFVCLGSTQHLKSKFSEGYTLIIKVRKTGSSGDLQHVELQPIEYFVKDRFPSAVTRERHEELMTFYIPDKTLPWSKMFGIMESGKKSLNIEDYSLGQCSLEQVFLTFTKQQRDE